MEPIAASGASAVFRPAGGGSSELGALLRDGRVLSAEVLARPGDSSVLLAIGRHTIPAESELALDPGARFLVRVEQGPEGVVLRLLGSSAVEEEALLAALRTVVGEERPVGEVLGELARALRASLGRGEPMPELRALAQALGALSAPPDGDPGALRTLLASLGLGHEAALAMLLGARSTHAAFAKLRGDLKALLLAAHEALAGGEPSELGESVARALTSLEAEQLLNLAREKAGEPLVLSFPFPDGDGWATARLAVPPRRERGESAAGEDEVPFRISLGLELTELGPLRADLTLTPTQLALRLLVTRPEVAERIEGELSELRDRLSGGRRALELHVRLATPAETALGLDPLDIRYLRERHLMNVAG